MTRDATGPAVNYRVALADDAGFEDWRPRARVALALAIPPECVQFAVGEDGVDLFSGCPLPAEAPLDRELTVPAAFKREADDAALHADPDRFQFLYRLLWRFREEPRLMAVQTDTDVVRLHRLAQAVRRDLHKMKAFVRFRQAPGESAERFVAWFEPAHHITPRAADFFRRRFTGMDWSLLTPAKSAHWDRHTLVFGEGVGRDQWAAIADANEDLWKVYFANIFNPARLMTKAMQSQMPRKYWKNMPETELIPDLVRSARARTEEMLAPPPRRSAGEAAGVRRRLRGNRLQGRAHDLGRRFPALHRARPLPQTLGERGRFLQAHARRLPGRHRPGHHESRAPRDGPGGRDHERLLLERQREIVERIEERAHPDLCFNTAAQNIGAAAETSRAKGRASAMRAPLRNIRSRRSQKVNSRVSGARSAAAIAGGLASPTPSIRSAAVLPALGR